MIVATAQSDWVAESLITTAIPLRPHSGWLIMDDDDGCANVWL